MHQFTIDGSPLNADLVYKTSGKQHSLYLSDSVIQKVAKNRAYLDNKMQDPNAVIYGINTGFGSLCNVRISDENLGKLQENLVLSHACGMGERVPEDKVKKEDEIIKKETEVRELQKAKFGPEGELFKKRQEMVSPIQDKVFAAIENYAAERGFDIIFDKGGATGLLFSNPEYDKTADIKKKLSIK